MTKIETIENEYIKLKVFAAARVYTNFEKQKGESLTSYFSNNQSDVEAMAIVLYLGHVAWSKLTGEAQVVESHEDIMDKLDLLAIANGLTAMLGITDIEEGAKKK